ncbi:hypothetical protein KGF54_000237 [Candida jiufengensis]|uniref:uncharacterized protein n=1 Tax=Candida jiufengensis TaxID=497108 RepID=UPI002224D506|nr:uncharacterized protein KGF54_000237 [Candida jiufengensis]KAI5957309.1 hypothetical protein KGF54_000237 [Candida jiufengensis]
MTAAKSGIANFARYYSIKSQANKTVQWASSKKPIIQDIKSQTLKAANAINLKAGSVLAKTIDKAQSSTTQKSSRPKLSEEDERIADLRRKIELNAKGYGSLQNKGRIMDTEGRVDDGF